MRELLIVGAGIAGSSAARAALTRPNVHVTLIDQHSYQTLPFQLARVAAGLTSFSQMALPLQSDRRLTIVRAAVASIDGPTRTVTTSARNYSGDGLVIALGRPPLPPPTSDDTTGPDVVSPYDTAAAARLRIAWQRALATAAQRSAEPAPLNIAVVGGGAFGCELALAIATAAPFACRRYGAAEALVRVTLFEAADRILPTWPRRAGTIVGRELHLAEVETCVGRRIDGITATGVRAGDEEWPADIVVWAAGRRTHPLLATAGLPLTDDGKLRLDRHLRCGNEGRTFAAGECAAPEAGWDWARRSGRIAGLNALARTGRLVAPEPRRRRYLNLPFGRALVLDGDRFHAAWPQAQRARLLVQRWVTGGWPLVMQAWPPPTPDHSLAAWRDAAERRRGRHGERDGRL